MRGAGISPLTRPPQAPPSAIGGILTDGRCWVHIPEVAETRRKDCEQFLIKGAMSYWLSFVCYAIVEHLSVSERRIQTRQINKYNYSTAVLHGVSFCAKLIILIYLLLPVSLRKHVDGYWKVIIYCSSDIHERGRFKDTNSSEPAFFWCVKSAVPFFKKLSIAWHCRYIICHIYHLSFLKLCQKYKYTYSALNMTAINDNFISLVMIAE